MSIEIVHGSPPARGQIRTAIFDFDGTLSTLRCGWEDVMLPMMVEMIGGGRAADEISAMVEKYIDESTGIQTVYQMRWLAGKVAEYGLNPELHDEWWYKDEYNRRLMRHINGRLQRLESGQAKPEEYLVGGAADFLKALISSGIEVCVASGTDHADVVHEAALLGLDRCFSLIQGAPHRQAACSKQAVIRTIIEQRGCTGNQLLLVGDGKVEIALGVENGAYTLGVASNETARRGVNPVKRGRLIKAGAHTIVGDFLEKGALLAHLGIPLPADRA